VGDENTKIYAPNSGFRFLLLVPRIATSFLVKCSPKAHRTLKRKDLTRLIAIMQEKRTSSDVPKAKRMTANIKTGVRSESYYSLLLSTTHLNKIFEA
jgi:hypothetical protein